MSSTDKIQPLPTLEDVARRAGVSTATVSRCLNDPDVVREKTRNRVEEAVTALNYAPNFGARALASNRTNTIGAIIPTMENSIFARGIQAMEETLAEKNITLLVATSNYDPQQEFQKLRTLIGRGVDGLALIGFERSEECYAFLNARSIPFVLLWNYAADSAHPCVGFDNRFAAQSIANRVLEFGHKDIVMISGRTAGNDRATGRVEGVRAALEAAKLSLAPEQIAECEYSFAAGEAAATKFLSRTKRPTAIICGNDVLAVGALHAAQELKLRVPEDLSIVGFDDIDLASAVQPALTTVHTPHGRMGRKAAEMLIALTSGETAQTAITTEISFETALVERASLGPAPS